MAPTPTLYGSRASREAKRDGRFGPLVGGAICLDFVNTVDRHHDPTARDDLGSGYVRFLDWSVHAALVDPEAARRLGIAAGKEPRDAAAVRRRVVALRAALANLLDALIRNASPDEDALSVLNDEVRQARLAESLVAGDRGLAWDVPGKPALDSPLLVIARDAATLLTSEMVRRIRQCDGPDCERFFLDSSRNGSRRYCSATGCGSQVRVRRFRERHRSPS